MTYTARRSVLYMPGSNLRALEKAKTLPADVLILDLEDAVSPEQKALARQQILEAANAGGYGKRELVIRVNGLDTEWGSDDIKMVAQTNAAGLCLPKVNSAADIMQVVDLLNTFGASSDLKLWPMAETVVGIHNIHEIAAADPRIAVIVMGTSDLAKELRARHTPDRVGLMASLSQCLLAARANQLDIVDGVHLDLSDEAGYSAVCEQGRDMGFDGKTLIHPKQIAEANRVFGPSEADVTWAEKLVAGWEAASARGDAVVLVDGKLVENLHVQEAKRILAMATFIKTLSD